MNIPWNFQNINLTNTEHLLEGSCGLLHGFAPTWTSCQDTIIGTWNQTYQAGKQILRNWCQIQQFCFLRRILIDYIFCDTTTIWQVIIHAAGLLYWHLSVLLALLKPVWQRYVESRNWIWLPRFFSPFYVPCFLCGAFIYINLYLISLWNSIQAL